MNRNYSHFLMASFLFAILFISSMTSGAESHSAGMPNPIAAVSTPDPQYKKINGADWLSGHGVDVYYRGALEAGCIEGQNLTCLYHCAELVVRLYGTLGYPQWRYKNAELIGHAYEMYDIASIRPPEFDDLSAYANGNATTPPRPGDIVVWDKSPSNFSGHVAIVRSVSTHKVQVVQQNFWYDGKAYPSADMTLSKGSNGRYTLSWAFDNVTIRGWIHSPRMDWVMSVNGYYQIKSVNSQRCLDVTGASNEDGVKVIQWACSNDDNQSWRLTPIGNGAYQVESKHSSNPKKCLDVNGASKKEGANVIQYRCNGGGNQKWLIIPYRYKDSNGNITNGNTFVAQHSQKCMDVSGAASHSGADIIQYTCKGSANQTWWLTKK